MNEPLIAFLHRLAIILRGSFPQKCAGTALSPLLPSRGETACLFFYDNADQVIALLPPSANRSLSYSLSLLLSDLFHYACRCRGISVIFGLLRRLIAHLASVFGICSLIIFVAEWLGSFVIKVNICRLQSAWEGWGEERGKKKSSEFVQPTQISR